MTKSQQYLIGAIAALFAVVIFVFRGDMFIIENRPGATDFLKNVIQPYGFGLFFLLFAYLLAKGFNTKWWLFIALFVCWELVYIFVLNFGAGFLPDSSKLTGWLTHFKKVALENRSMVQFQEKTAQFDDELFYTLKPGKSTYKSFEFNTNYKVNSLGVRDDENSLSNPDILFIGDSFTMGWGVEQEQSFPQIFENRSSLKVLNTGISSYGTAREYRMMARTKVDSLKAIIIQYHDTDLEENNYFIKNKRLGTRTQADFDLQVKENKKQLKYYPLKYLKTAMLNTVGNLQKKGETSITQEALTGIYTQYPDYLGEFYTILGDIKSLKDVPVIVTYTGSFYTNPKVIREFEAFAVKHGIKDVYFVNMADKLSHEDYFFFDDHINAKGHEKVAAELLAKYKTISTKL